MVLSDNKKLKLLQGIKENELRKEVLIPIYRNMGVFKEVLDNHGANENGVDIILIKEDDFGHFIYSGIVLKADKISNATQGGNTAANIVQQFDLAVIHGYDCIRTNHNVKFNFIYVITSYEVSNTARNNLNKKANSMSFSGLRFMTGADIIKLIDQYLPKFYYYQSGIHAQLAQALQEKCESLHDLKNIPMQTNFNELIQPFRK